MPFGDYFIGSLHLSSRIDLIWREAYLLLRLLHPEIILDLEDEEAQRVQSILRLSEVEVMEITHFERGNGLISTNNNNISVEFKCSQLEKTLITTDRRELQDILEKRAAKQN